MTLYGQNKLLSATQEYYDGSNWQNSYGYNYEYDTNNNLTIETGLTWSFIDSKWEYSDKITYTYNANNRVILELEQDWNSGTNQFDDSYRSTYTYNGSGDITELLDQIWDNGAWENEYRTTITYNAGMIDVAYFYEWDGTQWEAIDRSTLTYNGNNRVEKIDIDDWDGATWVIGDRDLYTYDMNNKIASKTFESWDGAAWVEEEKIEYTLVGGNRTMETTTYNSNSYIEEFVYDTNELMSSYAHPFKDKTGLDFIVDDNPYFNKILSQTYDSTSRTVYNYNNLITLATEDFKTTKNIIKVFPNPTSGNITIKTSKASINSVEIYSAIGAKVFFTKDTHFSIDSLNRGVYFLNLLTADGNTITKKIIKN